MRCHICNTAPTDTCHIRSKGAGGPDQEWNYMYLCRKHHQEQHRVGIVTFVERHPEVREYIARSGWGVVLELGQKKLRRSRS